MIICRRLFAYPTELVATAHAGYQVATIYLLNLCSTKWAESQILLASSFPVFVLPFHILLTRCIAMEVISTLKADTCTTLWALHFLVVKCQTFHSTFASLFRAPSSQWVALQKLLLSEHLKLLQDFWLIVFEEIC